MTIRLGLWTTGAAVAFAALGCEAGKGRSAYEQQMAVMDESKATRARHFPVMVDNALMSDMTIADMHFVPNTNELNGTGAARLDRLAPMLDTYGGTVKFDTTLEDKNAIQARMDHVKEYLATTGCNMSRVDVKPGLPSGSGTSAALAIENERSQVYGKGQPLGSGQPPPPIGGPSNY